MIGLWGVQFTIELAGYRWVKSLAASGEAGHRMADRGLLSTDNLADLQTITLPCGSALEVILTATGGRYGDFVEILEPIHSQKRADIKEEVLSESVWTRLRLVVAHDPLVAKRGTAKRDARIAELQKKTEQWSSKLNGQASSKKTDMHKSSHSDIGEHDLAPQSRQGLCDVRGR